MITNSQRRLITRHLTPYRSRAFALSAVMLSNIALQVVSPQFVRVFIDAATSGVSRSRLTQTAIAFIGLALIQQILNIGATYLGEELAWMATNSIRGALLRHCLTLDRSFHNCTSPGELIERIDGDVSQLSDFFSKVVLSAAGSLLLLPAVAIWGHFGLTPVEGGLMCLLALVQFTLPYVMFSWALRYVEAHQAAIVLLLEVVLNPVGTYLLIGERPPLATLLGGPLVLAGCAGWVIMVWRRERHRRRFMPPADSAGN